MAIEMLGAEVAKAMKERIISRGDRLKQEGIIPCLTIIRIGERPDDLSYERGAKKRMELTGIECRVKELPEDISQEEFEGEFRKVNADETVHGILLFRPLPAYKDVDCMSDVNLAKVFAGDQSGFAPCTAEAVMEMLEHYGIDVCGKKVTVVGRSMVVGRPLAMLMLQKNATVTVCHTRTAELAETCRNADILVAAAGRAKMITSDMIGEGAIVADVGINADAEGKMCGDVDYEGALEKASFISPVPRGVGSVTTSVLALHVIKAAEYLAHLE